PQGRPLFHGWGPTARLLPYVEGHPGFNACNFDLPNETPANVTVLALGTNTYLCPSDPNNTTVFVDGTLIRNNTNYGVNRGDWYVWGGSSGAPAPSSPFPANAAQPLAALAHRRSGSPP